MKRILSFVLAVVLVLGLVPVRAEASEKCPIEPTYEIYVNPLYADILGKVTLPQIPPLLLSEEPEYMTSYDAVVAALRSRLVNREQNIVLYYQSQTLPDSLMKTIFYDAIAHTGVPTEGDYLRWQYGAMGLSLSGYIAGDVYYLTLAYTASYYTTAEQEQTMDTEVASLLQQLQLEGLTDYETVKAIYDWICQNITYDYVNLNDDTYLLKHSAYAALMNKTAVCQGYAVLLYRLLLEEGIDCRLISGYGGGPHGWNIVQLEGLYYNVDSTWDAGETEYSYFLCCPDTFTGHVRDTEFETEQFHAAYPMASQDYAVPCQHENTVLEEAVEATCTKDGYTGDTVCQDCGERITQGTVIPAKHSYDETSTCTLCGSIGGSCGEDLTWTLEEGVLTISGTGAMDQYLVSVPALSVYAPWWPHREKIQTVLVEPGVTTIGNCAFASCSNLAEVSLPDTLTFIGMQAFSNTGLTEVTIPAAVNSLGMAAFSGCASMATVTFQGDAPNIGLNAFQGVTAQANYPLGNDTWQETDLRNYGGELTWKPVCPGHIYEGEIIPPSCEDPGYTIYTCTICGNSYEGDETEALGHQYDGWDIGGNSHWHHCILCGTQLDYAAHDFGTGDQCSVCGYQRSHVHQTVPAERKEPSCTETGIAAHYTCIGCDDWFLDPAAIISVINKNTLVLPALDHSFTNYVNNEDATCVADGTKTAQCDRCEETDTVTAPGSALGHSFTNYVNNSDATCTTDGTKTAQCDRCEETDTVIAPGSALGHSFTNYVNNGDATCTTDGTKTAQCDCCEETNTVTAPGSALGHSFTNYVNNGDATCTTDGTKTAQCDRCEETNTVSDPGSALGHEYENGVCSRCGDPSPDTPEPASLHRISGAGRCQTAIAAARELQALQGGGKFRTIVVADGSNYPDALSGSYLAAATGAPILLVQPLQQLTVLRYLYENLDPEGTVYILGGTNSVSETFERMLQTFAGSERVIRLAGRGRYDTSLAIIREADKQLSAQGKAHPGKVLVCNGGGYADSLSASAVGLPVLLVDGSGEGLTEAQEAYLKEAGKPEIYIIGGTKSVSESIRSALNTLDADGDAKRLSGDTRDHTSVLVAEEFFPNAEFVVLANGGDYPDGLSGGPVAFAKGAPLLLVREGMESHARDYAAGISSGYILGGTNSVSDTCVKNIFGADCTIAKK